MAQLAITPLLLNLGAQLLPVGLSALSQAGASRRGPRMSELHLQGSSEGAAIPVVYGRMRISGQVIWAAPFKETASGGKGGPAGPPGYTVSFAVGLCEGPIARIGQVWANGRPLDLSRLAWRLHRGEETQTPDPLIEAAEGASAPAYRGLAYVVFEDFPLDEFGATLPQLSFEVLRGVVGETPLLEQLAQGVCLIPGAGEFAYATQAVRRRSLPGVDIPENEHAEAGRADLLVSLDQLQQDLPNCRSVLLVVGWFGSDLRCGQCEIRPKVDHAEKLTEPLTWSVAGLTRDGAAVVSASGGGPAYGGTPSDETVRGAIAELKRRGFKVGLYPFLFMDIPSGAGLPDPHGGAEQAAYPWRGRITLSKAPGQPGSPDGTAAADTEIAAFFGAPAEWRFRRFILHYAALAQAAGGVDAFVLGSELRGLTTARGAGGAYPAVAQLKTLAQECRALLGGAKLTYAADWSEYFGHQPGGGIVRYHLDPLWADPNIDMVGVDWYPPLADWRDGEIHADAALSQDGRDLAYLQAQIEGGNQYDWFYADASAREAQARQPIADSAHAKPWVFRPKDLRNWWANPHFERTGGVEHAAPTAWIAESKPIWLIELGAPAVDKGANEPNLFPDPKSAESGLPLASSGAPDDLIQRRLIEAYLDYWRPEGPNNPVSRVYGGPMLAPEGTHLWAWDARPFPAFPARLDAWADGPAWRTGHWLNGRAGAGELGAVIADLAARAGLSEVDVSGVRGLALGYAIDGPATAREVLEPLLLVHGLQAVERGGLLRFLPPPASALEISASLLERPRFERADGAAPLAELQVAFLDPAGGYRLGVASALSQAPGAVEVRRIEAPFALGEQAARAAAERLLAAALEARQRARVELAPGVLAPEPGDRVRLDGLSFEIEAVEEGAARMLSLRRAAGAPAAPLALEAPATPSALSPSAPAVLVFAPPPLTPEETDARPLAAAFAAPWGGPLDVLAGTEASTLRARGEILRPAIMGELLWDLYPGPVGRWDEGNFVEARFYGEAPVSVTRAEALEGANRFALLQPDGRVEILQVARVELVGEGRWLLRDFLRGLAGTADAMGAPTPAGARLVLLDGRLARVELSPEEWEAALLWRFAWRAGGRASETEAALPRTFDRPFAPAHLKISRQNGDLHLGWIRQARLGGDPWSSLEPPLGEAREAYLVEIFAGATLLRSFETTTPTAVYTAAQQAADGAAGLLRIKVAQISAISGAGARAESSHGV